MVKRILAAHKIEAGCREWQRRAVAVHPGDILRLASPLPQHAKRAVEAHLLKSGIAYTILQPTFFTEVLLSPAAGFDAASARAQIYGSGENKISWISLLDVARFAAASVENPGARNTVIRLGGPEALSPLEVVRIFEELSGQAFTLTYVSEDALRAQKAAATNSLDEAFPALMLSYAQGDVIDMERAFAVYPLLRSRLAGVKDYAKHTLGLA